MRAASFHAPGDVRIEDVPTPAPGTGEITVRNHACGLNFIDTYQRSGLYPMPMPSGATSAK